MSLINKYQNIRLKNKLLINLSIIFITFLLIGGTLFLFLQKTFVFINQREALIENYSKRDLNNNFDTLQNFINISIIRLSIDDEKWDKLYETALKNVLIYENYLRSPRDTANFELAKSSLTEINNLYNNELNSSISKITALIEDSLYTNYDENVVLAELNTKFNEHFRNIKKSLNNIDQDLLEEIFSSYRHIKSAKTKVYFVIFISIIPFLFFLILFYFVFKRRVINYFEDIIDILERMAKGDISERIKVKSKDEIGKILQAIKDLLIGIKRITAFAKEIENGNFDSDFNPRSDKDELGIALIDMRAGLKESKLKEIENQKREEKRTWTANEITKYGDILRKNNDDLSKLGDAIIENLIHTLKANQGGLFIINDDNQEDINLELIAAYAYDRKKYHTKTIALGEGLVGTCAIEKDTVYLKEIPEDYIEIISGLGEANPRNLILVPLKLENKVLGVVELASFYEFEDYKIAFLEKVAENIASTLANTKINAKTALLLSQSQQQAEELASQEEEMRQNMEELQATQEEAARQSAELQGVFDAINENTGTIEFSPEGIILDANEFILNSLKLKMSMIDKKHHSIILSAEEKESDEFSRFWEVIRRGETRVLTRRYFVSQNEVWLKETFKPLFDANGNLYKVLAMYNDITDTEVQKRELENKAKELSDFQEKMRLNQVELKKTNDTLAARESIMKKALEKAKKIEKELNEKNEQMAAQEAEMLANLEQVAVAHEEKENELKKVRKEFQKVKSEKRKLLKQLEDAQDKVEILENEIQKLKNE